MKHLAKIQPHNPNEPDSSMPWCPTCRLHTEYHIKVLRRGWPERQANFYSCDVCDGKTWKPTNPKPLDYCSVVLFLFLQTLAFILCMGQDYGFTNKNMVEEGLGCFVLSFFVGYLLYWNSKANRNHWKAFHKWAEAQGQQTKEA